MIVGAGDQHTWYLTIFNYMFAETYLNRKWQVSEQKQCATAYLTSLSELLISLGTLPRCNQYTSSSTRFNLFSLKKIHSTPFSFTQCWFLLFLFIALLVHDLLKFTRKLWHFPQLAACKSVTQVCSLNETLKTKMPSQQLKFHFILQ